MRVLATREELAAGLQELEGASTYYIDTEFESSKRGKRLCLIQISRGDEVYLVDALRLGALPDLGAVLCRPGSEWVLHAGLQDLELLLPALRVESAPKLFDTQVVWGLTGPEAGVSLAFLIFRVLGLRSSKGYQADDWLRRPLPPAQLEYAAQDIAHLPALERHLRQRARELGRNDLIPEVCRELLLPAAAEPLPITFESFRNAWQLDAVGRSALRGLLAWHNSLPSGGLALPPKALLSIASRLPSSVQDLSRIKGVSPHVSRVYGDQIVSLLAQAKREAPESNAIEPLDYASFADFVREARLLLIRAELCAELSIAPDLALPMALVRRMQQRANAAGDLAAAGLELRGWREFLLGEAFARHARRFAP